MSLTARLENIDFAIACGHPSEARALADRLKDAKTHHVGTFSGYLGETTGGRRVVALAAGESSVAASRAVTAQLAYLCPHARMLAHFGIAGAAGRRFDPGEAVFLRETAFLNLPRAVHSPDQKPLLHPWLAGPAGNPLPARQTDLWLSQRREASAPLRELARRQLFQEALLASAPDPVDTPMQREWILRRDPPDDLIIDREGAGSAEAAAEAGKPWVAVKAVSDSLATLRPGGLASRERPERPALLDSLDRAAERLLGLLRATVDLEEEPEPKG
jgi:nucleoside phosphorylase